MKEIEESLVAKTSTSMTKSIKRSPLSLFWSDLKACWGGSTVLWWILLIMSTVDSGFFFSPFFWVLLLFCWGGSSFVPLVYLGCISPFLMALLYIVCIYIYRYKLVGVFKCEGFVQPYPSRQA